MKKYYMMGCCLLFSAVFVSGCNFGEMAPGPIKDGEEETQEFIARF
ncbi:hypothetical protein QTG56_22625 (plasmid) [Rossellomorea sp. AcN35-11]|nr:hypothetical protein [Rossellomorea aquimaris]WJV32169.1 hypothetical protein QTG56_22625 [Rossellomorea sp. AcN35-11]